MTQPTAPFKLHAPVLSPDVPADSADQLPPEVAGQPAKYFWKDMIHSGQYVHPTRKFSLAVDTDRLNAWADTGAQMLDAGLAIPINCDHSDSARDVVGYLKGFKIQDQQLLGLCQFIGEEAALTAARNFVSVGIDPDFVDGQGRQWGEAIVHLALTPVPVVPGQDQFVLAETAATPAVSNLPCTAEQFQVLCNLIGQGLSEADCISRVIDALQSKSPDSPDLQAELAAAKEQVFQLSARLPPVLPHEAQQAIGQLAAAKFDAAVQRGALSPSARDRLVTALVSGPDGVNVLMLSRSQGASGQCLAETVAEILLDNQPIQLGESTRLQALARPIPGADPSPIDELRKYMTKVASVSG